MIKEIKGYIKKELTIVFYSCRIQLTSTDVENKILGESTMKIYDTYDGSNTWDFFSCIGYGCRK